MSNYKLKVFFLASFVLANSLTEAHAGRRASSRALVLRQLEDARLERSELSHLTPAGRTEYLDFMDQIGSARPQNRIQDRSERLTGYLLQPHSSHELGNNEIMGLRYVSGRRFEDWYDQPNHIAEMFLPPGVNNETYKIHTLYGSREIGSSGNTVVEVSKPGHAVRYRADSDGFRVTDEFRLRVERPFQINNLEYDSMILTRNSVDEPNFALKLNLHGRDVQEGRLLPLRTLEMKLYAVDPTTGNYIKSNQILDYQATKNGENIDVVVVWRDGNAIRTQTIRSRYLDQQFSEANAVEAASWNTERVSFRTLDPNTEARQYIARLRPLRTPRRADPQVAPQSRTGVDGSAVGIQD